VALQRDAAVEDLDRIDLARFGERDERRFPDV